MLDRFYKINCRINDWLWNPTDGYQSRYQHLVTFNGSRASAIIDFGAGSVDLRSRFSGLAAGKTLVVSCDLDGDRLKINSNPNCVVANGAELPFASGSVDLIVSDNAFEHLTDPEAVLHECGRVLKPGGTMIFATPHKYSYISLIAALVPFQGHVWMKRLQGTSVIDVSETFYQLNTLRDVNQHSRAADMEVVSLEFFVGAPCYTLRLPPPIHFAMVLLHSLINRVDLLRRWFGITLVGVLRPADKKGSALAHDRRASCTMSTAPKMLPTVLETR